MTTLVLIGLLVAYWFWDASTFLKGSQPDMTQTSFLPIVCSINADRAADLRISSSVFFWQGSTRIDLEMVGGSAPIQVHEFINSVHTAYIWRDDNPNGDMVRDVTEYPLLKDVPPKNEWFCFPNVFFDPSKFTVPKDINFNQA